MIAAHCTLGRVLSPLERKTLVQNPKNGSSIVLAEIVGEGYKGCNAYVVLNGKPYCANAPFIDNYFT
jgi:hypothetical protein